MTKAIKVQMQGASLNLPFRHASRKAAASTSNAKVGGGIIRAGRRSYVAALVDINLTIRDGERIAVLGHNGAGKTTLLRTISGIYTPNAGVCRVNGRVSALFSSSIGLDMNATGLENIYKACILFGVKKSDMAAVEKEVIEFSELGAFIEMPMATYSAGMRARLGFAIVTSVDPDILIVDEVLSTGDMVFAQKAQRRILDYVKKAKALIVASHSADLMRMFCTRAIWMEKGRVMKDGPFEEVWTAYYESKKQ